MPETKEIQFNWPLVGHKNIVNFLQKSIANDKLAHAYLFYGSEHIGKTTLAENFTASLLCQNDSGETPCKNCVSCRQFFKRIHPDVYMVEKEEGKKNISIEQIRNLQHSLNMQSFLNSYKVALIKGAEHLNHEAFNAFLKTLEEPAEKTIIILLAKNINSFPKTIISRCQVFKLLPVSADEISEHLIDRLGLDKKQAQNLAHLSLGRPGEAINFFQIPELLENYRSEAAQFVSIIQGGLTEKFQILDNLFKGLVFLESVDILQKKLAAWRLLIRDLILINSGAEKFIIHLFLKEELKRLAKNYSPKRLADILEKISQTQKYLGQNVNPRLAAENLLLNL